jgi:hypothetical protein
MLSDLIKMYNWKKKLGIYDDRPDYELADLYQIIDNEDPRDYKTYRKYYDRSLKVKQRVYNPTVRQKLFGVRPGKLTKVQDEKVRRREAFIRLTGHNPRNIIA